MGKGGGFFVEFNLGVVDGGTVRGAELQALFPFKCDSFC